MPKPLNKKAAALAALLTEVRACRECASVLPLGPRPVLRASVTARLLIVGQAPGTKVHATGIPWNDPSGDRLRSWLELDRQKFYDEGKIAIIPMGFCYPGRHPRGGDLPPRKECATLWLPRLLDLLSERRLTLLVGSYAQAHYLGKRCKKSLMDTVRAWPEYLPEYFPLPHPSARNTLLLRRNPWFEEELLPELRSVVATVLDSGAMQQ